MFCFCFEHSEEHWPTGRGVGHDIRSDDFVNRAPTVIGTYCSFDAKWKSATCAKTFVIHEADWFYASESYSASPMVSASALVYVSQTCRTIVNMINHS